MKNFIIIILIVLALGAGWYFWSTNNENNSNETTTQEEMTTDTTESDSTTTDNSNNLLALLQSRETKTCTYSMEQEGTTISGVAYIAGDNMRNNYEVSGEEQNITGSMIKMGDTMYIWGSSMPQGIKMQVNMEELAAQYSQNGDQQLIPGQNMTPFDITKQTEYTCANWVSDDSMFTPPADVTFTDMSEMMQTMPAMTDPQEACAMCDSFSGENKEACLQELNCQ